MGVTSDRNDPGLTYGVDDAPVPQAPTYLVLSDEEMADGLVRPRISSYIHARELGGCGAVTHMNDRIARTYAREPGFYGSTYCTGCSMHRPVGREGEFFWVSTFQATWLPGGVLEPSEQSITANKLRVGT